MMGLFANAGLPSDQPLPLRRCRLFETQDVDETRDHISRIMQPHELRPLGRSAGNAYHMDYLHLSRLGMGTIALGRMHVDVGHLDDYHLVVLCLQGHARLTLDRGETIIDRTHGVCLAPGDPFRGDFSEDCEQFVLRIDPRLVDAHTGRRNSRLTPIIDLNRSNLQPWLGLVNSIVHDAHAIEMIQTNDRVAADYEQLFINLLLAGQGVAPLHAGRSNAAPASVRRAELFIRSHFCEALRLEDIAAAAAVPTRTLLDGFRQFRQTSPMRFLRDIRLDEARDRLLLHSSEMVSTIAFDVGFGHLGRFAREYSERFGETPSQTRVKSRAGSSRR